MNNKKMNDEKVRVTEEFMGFVQSRAEPVSGKAGAQAVLQ